VKFNLISAASGTLRFHLDNIIYRREIGMDSFGRLKKTSPILAAHGLMLACTVAVTITMMSKRWDLLLYLSGSLVLAMSLGAYPAAYYRAFRSFQRERIHGTLEQIYLTNLRPQEIFDGKFFGTLAIFFEARRYLLFYCVCVMLALFKLLYFEWLLGGIAGLLILVNHYGFSVYRGILGGMKTGAQKSKFLQAFLEDGEHNAYLNHLGVILTGKSLWRVIWGSSFFVMRFLFRWPSLDSCIVMASLAALLISFSGNVQLSQYENAERQRFMRGFRKMFNFDSSPEGREEGYV